MTTQKNIKITIKDIDDYLKHGSIQTHLIFEKGSKTNGVSHKVFLSPTKYSKDQQKELFRAKTNKELLNKLEGFYQGIQLFRLFSQR